MNRIVFTHTIALLIGATGGYLVANKMLEDRYADLAQAEIDSVKEMYERKMQKIIDRTIPDENGMTDEKYGKGHVVEGDHPEETSPVEEKTESIPEQVRRLKKEGMTVTEIADEMEMADNIVEGILNQNTKSSPLVRSEPKTPYHQMAKENGRAKAEMPKNSIEHQNVFKQAGPRKEIEPSDEEEVETPERYEHTPDERDLAGIDRTQPYVISSEEYNDEFVEHDKLSIYYYMLDDVLCDENEEVMDDISNTVGYDCFKVLENAPTAWVRNERLGIDYEICVVRSSYAEVVHGIPQKVLSPREEYQKRQARRGNQDE